MVGKKGAMGLGERIADAFYRSSAWGKMTRMDWEMEAEVVKREYEVERMKKDAEAAWEAKARAAGTPTVTIREFKVGEPITWTDLGPGVGKTWPGGVAPEGEDSRPAHYGIRVYPKEMQSAIRMLQSQPTALAVLHAMSTCLGHGCVIKATREKILDVTGISPSSYTRSLNILLGLGLIWPNTIKDDYQPGFVIDADLPKAKNKNGVRYKLAPFLAFRGPQDIRHHELNRYNTYMRQRIAKRLTPTYSPYDNAIAFVEAVPEKGESDE